MLFLPYNRGRAVEYAHRWAFGRNPDFYDFSEIGGDCTNFASQCLFAGAGVMNFTPEFGWYYLSPDNRAAAWAGVEFFWNFMTRTALSRGPIGRAAGIEGVMPGDFVQLKFQESREIFAHTPVVVSVGEPPVPENILVAAHSYDADNRPLSTYQNVEDIRFLHILGVLRDTEPVQTLRQENGAM